MPAGGARGWLPDSAVDFNTMLMLNLSQDDDGNLYEVGICLQAISGDVLSIHDVTTLMVVRHG